jgi:hypothetical protein
MQIGQLIDINRYQLLVKLPEKKCLSERAQLLEEMLAIVNIERLNTKWKPMSPKLFAIKMSHLNISDLYYTHSVSKDSKNRRGSYSKYLWWSIKV